MTIMSYVLALFQMLRRRHQAPSARNAILNVIALMAVTRSPATWASHRTSFLHALQKMKCLRGMGVETRAALAMSARRYDHQASVMKGELFQRNISIIICSIMSLAISTNILYWRAYQPVCVGLKYRPSRAANVCRRGGENRRSNVCRGGGRAGGGRRMWRCGLRGRRGGVARQTSAAK